MSDGLGVLQLERHAQALALSRGNRREQVLGLEEAELQREAAQTRQRAWISGRSCSFSSRSLSEASHHPLGFSNGWKDKALSAHGSRAHAVVARERHLRPVVVTASWVSSTTRWGERTEFAGPGQRAPVWTETETSGREPGGSLGPGQVAGGDEDSQGVGAEVAPLTLGMASG